MAGVTIPLHVRELLWIQSLKNFFSWYTVFGNLASGGKKTVIGLRSSSKALLVRLGRTEYWKSNKFPTYSVRLLGAPWYKGC